MSQDPQGGASLVKGGKVTLSVSKGPATSQVPDVTGYNQPDAVALLKAAGFKVGVVPQDVTDPSQDGLVQSQDPPGNTPLKPGAVVTIVVGRLTGGGTQTTTTGTTTTTPGGPSP